MTGARALAPFSVNEKANPPLIARRGGYLVQSFSRGGFVIQALGTLIKRAGLQDHLGFLACGSSSHQVIVENKYGDREFISFEVIRDGFDQLISRTLSFIRWCRENPDETYEAFENLGSAIDGRDFEDMVDVVDNTDYSMHPNEDYCEKDGWNAPLAICTLKTFVRFLMQAKAHSGQKWVEVEHWEGLEPLES